MNYFLGIRNNSIYKFLNPTDFFFHLTLSQMSLIIYGCGLLVCGFLVSLCDVQLPLTQYTRFKEPGF